ncbi:hypothetical protein [Klebsiella quasipneumoniae]|uniref:hypothetical protein n=1 Tax=Klebsiella quasipneumoniae TaxID=1463165 RepID=UPI00388E1630
MGSCAAPSAKGDDKFITTDYLQQCHRKLPELRQLESGRVRVEAKRASEEYGRVLRRYPLKPGETVERPQRGEVVSSSGVLPPLDPGEY